jgi:membrane protease YdiL (CAAX protease family)
MVFIEAALFTPIVEELFMRGLLFRRLRSMIPFLPTALITSALFGVLHGHPISIIYTFVMGFLFAFIYEKKQTILAPIAAHMAVNITGVLSSYLIPGSFYEKFSNQIIITVVTGLVFISALIYLIKRFKDIPKCQWQVKAVL